MMSKEPRRPRKPNDIGEAGGRLWRKVVELFDLEPHELTVLEEICRVKDKIEMLDKIVAEEGPVITSPQGKKTHPSMVEARNQRIVFARLAGVLRFPVKEDM